MNTLLLVIDALISTHQTAKRRIHCARRGHQWLPVLDAHLCRVCGLRKD